MGLGFEEAGLGPGSSMNTRGRFGMNPSINTAALLVPSLDKALSFNTPLTIQAPNILCI